MSLCHKLSNPYIFATRWCKPLIFQTKIIKSNKIHCLKYLRFKTFRFNILGLEYLSLWQKIIFFWYAFYEEMKSNSLFYILCFKFFTPCIFCSCCLVPQWMFFYLLSCSTLYLALFKSANRVSNSLRLVCRLTGISTCTQCII